MDSKIWNSKQLLRYVYLSDLQKNTEVPDTISDNLDTAELDLESQTPSEEDFNPPKVSTPTRNEENLDDSPMEWTMDEWPPKKDWSKFGTFTRARTLSNEVDSGRDYFMSWISKSCKIHVEQ